MLFEGRPTPEKKLPESFLETLLTLAQKTAEARAEEEDPLVLRGLAERASRFFPENDFLGASQIFSQFEEIPFFCGDEEFKQLLRPRSQEQSLAGFLDDFLNSGNRSCAVHLSPGFWQEGLWNPADHPEFKEFVGRYTGQRFLFRLDFLSQEWEFYQSFALGFRGVCSHARFFDHYQLQFFTEVCRDYRASYIIWVSTLSDLEKALETDCPYIGLWCCHPETFKPVWSIFETLAPRVPKNCKIFVMLPEVQPLQTQVIRKEGIKGLFL